MIHQIGGNNVFLRKWSKSVDDAFGFQMITKFEGFLWCLTVSGNEILLMLPLAWVKCNCRLCEIANIYFSNIILWVFLIFISLYRNSKDFFQPLWCSKAMHLQNQCLLVTSVIFFVHLNIELRLKEKHYNASNLRTFKEKLLENEITVASFNDLNAIENETFKGFLPFWTSCLVNDFQAT